MRTVDAREAARLLQLNVKRVQGLARSGRLPAHRIGRKWLFRVDELEALVGGPREPERDGLAGLSARNHLRGTIVGLVTDGLMAEVRLRIGDQEVVSVITRSSAERLHLAVGDTALAVIKSTEIMIGKEGSAA